MSDPVPDRLRPRPTRAAPLQPDKPGGSGKPPEADPSASQSDEAAAAKQREQAQTALENTRDGYG